jgi:hypothetical protein
VSVAALLCSFFGAKNPAPGCSAKALPSRQVPLLPHVCKNSCRENKINYYFCLLVFGPYKPCPPKHVFQVGGQENFDSCHNFFVLLFGSYKTVSENQFLIFFSSFFSISSTVQKSVLPLYCYSSTIFVVLNSGRSQAPFAVPPLLKYCW